MLEPVISITGRRNTESGPGRFLGGRSFLSQGRTSRATWMHKTMTELNTENVAVDRGPPARAARDVPGPAGLPYVGNTVEVVRDPLSFLTRISRQYGDVVRFTLPGQTVLLLNHPDAIEEVLKTKSDYLRKDAFTQRLSIAVGRG